MSEILSDLISRNLLPGNSNLWFEQIARDADGVNHVMCYDTPVVSGLDTSETRPQLLCTDEEIYDDSEYTYRNQRKQNESDMLISIDCDICHNKLVQTWSRSGKLEDGEAEHFMRKIDFGKLVNLYIEIGEYSKREISEWISEQNEFS